VRISRFVQNGSMISSSSQVLAFCEAKVMARATGKPITRHRAVVRAAAPADFRKIFRYSGSIARA
jgi:hypothetical protein